METTENNVREKQEIMPVSKWLEKSCLINIPDFMSDVPPRESPSYDTIIRSHFAHKSSIVAKC
jgi:hypothetical protein